MTISSEFLLVNPYGYARLSFIGPGGAARKILVTPTRAAIKDTDHGVWVSLVVYIDSEPTIAIDCPKRRGLNHENP